MAHSERSVDAPVGGEPAKGDLNLLYQAVLLGLCFPLARYFVIFLPPDWSQHPPPPPPPAPATSKMLVHLLAKMDSRAKVYGTGRLQGLIMPGAPSLSDPEGSFCTHVAGVSLTPQMGSV